MAPMLLTVAIPTFNRAPLLDTLLARLAVILRSVLFPVEVLVVNNQSTDHTDSICRKHASSLPNFRYVENEHNIGAERNVALCSALAGGEFVYVLGDDDDISEEFFETVHMNFRANPGVDVFIMNYAQASRDMSEIICGNVLGIDEDVEFSRLRDFLKTPGCWECIGFISAIIFRRRRFVDTDYDYYTKLGSFYGHCGSILEAFIDKPTYLVASPLVTQRQFNQRGDENKPEEATALAIFDSYLGVIRLFGTIVDKNIMSMNEIEMITAKDGFEPIGQVPLVGLPEWYARRFLKPALLRHADKFTKSVYDETRGFTQRITDRAMRHRILALIDLGYFIATQRWMLREW